MDETVGAPTHPGSTRQSVVLAKQRECRKLLKVDSCARYDPTRRPATCLTWSVIRHVMLTTSHWSSINGKPVSTPSYIQAPSAPCVY